MINNLRVLSVNVVGVGQYYDYLLALAEEYEVQVVYVQEPWWTITSDGKRLTKGYPRYTTFSLYEDWTRWGFRVVTYVRKDPGLDLRQIRPSLAPIVLWLKVEGVTLCNVYRPVRVYRDLANGRGDPLVALREQKLTANIIVTRDFNAVYWLQQKFKDSNKATIDGRNVVKQVNKAGLVNRNPEGSTYDRGNTIDLVFNNVPLLVSTNQKFRSGSDYVT